MRTSKSPYPHWMWVLVTYLYTVVMIGGTLPTPLYPIYAQEMDFTPLTITLVFAIYVLGVLATLLTCGKLSDRYGRKTILIPGLLIAAISGGIFMTADSVSALFWGRVVSGMSVGLTVGAATAYLLELETNKARAALTASFANMLGLGLGALLSGLLAERAAAPTVLPYGVFLLLLLPSLLLLVLPETVPRHHSAQPVRMQLPRVPRSMRLPFAGAAIASFAAFAFLGLFSSLAGNLLASSMQKESPQLTGLITFLAFSSGAIAQLFAARSEGQRAVLQGLFLLPLALSLVIWALPDGRMWLFLGGTVVGGMGAGMAFKGALSVISTLSPADRKGEVTSCFFLVSYVGLTLPVIGLGALLTTVSLFAAAVSFAGLITLVAGVSIAFSWWAKAAP